MPSEIAWCAAIPYFPRASFSRTASTSARGSRICLRDVLEQQRSLMNPLDACRADPRRPLDSTGESAGRLTGRLPVCTAQAVPTPRNPRIHRLWNAANTLQAPLGSLRGRSPAATCRHTRADRRARLRQTVLMPAHPLCNTRRSQDHGVSRPSVHRSISFGSITSRRLPFVPRSESAAGRPPGMHQRESKS